MHVLQFFTVFYLSATLRQLLSRLFATEKTKYNDTRKIGHYWKYMH